MSYKYDPPRGYRADVTRRDIALEFSRWNAQAGEPVVSDSDLPLATAGQRQAACRFLLRGQTISVKVDKWEDFATNLRCCYLIIRDMRLGEARGLMEAIREAYAQLPAGKRERDPWEVLGVRPDTPFEDIEVMYRSKTKRAHPDAGGSNDAMQELNNAFERIKAEKR